MWEEGMLFSWLVAFWDAGWDLYDALAQIDNRIPDSQGHKSEY